MLTSPSWLASAAGARVWPALPPKMTISITLFASAMLTSPSPFTSPGFSNRAGL